MDFSNLKPFEALNQSADVREEMQRFTDNFQTGNKQAGLHVISFLLLSVCASVRFSVKVKTERTRDKRREAPFNSVHRQ